MTKAGTAASPPEKKAFAPKEVKELPYCANAPACLRLKSQGAYCEVCAAKALAREKQDRSLMPNSGLCSSPDTLGSACVPMNHAAGCPFPNKPSQKQERKRQASAHEVALGVGSGG